MATIVEMVKTEKQKQASSVLTKEQLEYLNFYSKALASGLVTPPSYGLAGIDSHYRTPNSMHDLS